MSRAGEEIDADFPYALREIPVTLGPHAEWESGPQVDILGGLLRISRSVHRLLPLWFVPALVMAWC